MKTLTRLFILIGCVLSFQFSFAKTYNVVNGDVAGLIRAMEEANSSSQDDEILLAPNGLYIVSSAGFVGAEGFWNDGSEGPLAFPLISNRSKLIINGRGATIKNPINRHYSDFS
ncbi:MAG: hypothetical protein HC913_05590 [Microscillaceae bacterium]|nr:hypothetical protein [Microscillaceae bacterium]